VPYANILLERSDGSAGVSRQDSLRQANETGGYRTNPVGGRIGAAMRDTNENDPPDPGVRFEDQRPLHQIVRRERSVKAIRVTLEDVIPENTPGCYCLHLGKQPAQAVADQDHILCFGIELIHLF
jgi:hypothetical protein